MIQCFSKIDRNEGTMDLNVGKMDLNIGKMDLNKGKMDQNVMFEFFRKKLNINGFL